MKHKDSFILRYLGTYEYQGILEKMRAFTLNRTPETLDEIWLLEHPSVYTQGQAGKKEHILKHTNIPVIQSDRGGQVTYHGPGQIICYPMIDIRRKGISIKDLVCAYESTVIDLLKLYNIEAHRKQSAPGVYVDNEKICSLGIRVRKGASYHGLSLNVDMDLTPFSNINPCGYANIKVTQLKLLNGSADKSIVQEQLLSSLTKHLHYNNKPDIIYDSPPDITRGKE